MSPKPPKKSRGNGIGDLMDNSIQATNLVLNMVQQAAQYAPVPYLQQAAKATLVIMDNIQRMKDNKADFKRLGHSATSIVAAVWQAYERSPNKAFWPPRELSEVIRELMFTLDDIREFIDDRIKKSRTIRFITTVTDRAKIQEYRERLDDAISKFEEIIKVSSHLNINDAVYQLLRENQEIRVMLDSQKSDSAKVLEKLEHDNERIEHERQERDEEERLKEERNAQLQREREEQKRKEALQEDEARRIAALQESRRRDEEVEAKRAADVLRLQKVIEEQQKRLEELERSNGLKAEEELSTRISDATMDDEAKLKLIYAEIDRLKIKEQEQRVQSHSLNSKGKKAWVESDVDDETATQDYSTTQTSESEEDELQSRRSSRRKEKQRHQKKPTSSGRPSPQPSQFQPQQFQPPPDLSGPFSQMAIGYNPPQGPAYSPSPPFSPPYSPPYPPYAPHPYSSPALLPPPPPHMGYPYGGPSYGSPAHLNNVNSGNVSYSTVSNVGNDHSVNYGNAARRSKRKSNI
ncbi:hypothetical protein CVT26_006484 [Gymnopilus dilepis]|uniref:Uncharacterized protein n=1 Tax=Gymnopilus dilepis TaxID=231916 RepID=A0A409W6F6_9AGAR|nr:hypothetical protein CVT26_006484 [Gymnopilus dilepis]